MAKVMYKARFEEIVPVVVESWSAHFVKIEGHSSRDKKRTDWQSFFNTWDEAKDWLVSKQEGRLARQKDQLKYEEEKLERLKSLSQEGC